MEKDIALAIQKEEEYLKRKVKDGDGTANIYEYLAEAGYEDINEYRQDAQEYWIISQNYQFVLEPKINADIPIPYISNKLPAFLYSITCGENYAFVPNSYENYDLLTENGYNPVKLGYESSNGPILSSDGDLRIYLILKKHNNIKVSYTYFLNKLVQYLSNYFDNVIADNNDIIIDNKKVLGGALIDYLDDLIIIVFQINFVDKEEDIINICGQNKKIPGYIDSSIVTAEQLKNLFLTWLHIQ